MECLYGKGTPPSCTLSLWWLCGHIVRWLCHHIYAMAIIVDQQTPLLKILRMGLPSSTKCASTCSSSTTTSLPSCTDKASNLLTQYTRLVQAWIYTAYTFIFKIQRTYTTNLSKACQYLTDLKALNTVLKIYSCHTKVCACTDDTCGTKLI